MRRFALAVVLGAAMLRAPPCLAQADADSLAAARQLFTEAVGDQEAKRYEAALDEFRRVAAVKDTANVRYRIATCLEALGRKAEALASYDAAVRLGAQDPAAADAVQASRTRAAQLDPSVARLSVVLPPDAPPGVAVTVDDAPVDAATLGTAMPLDPGHHTIKATAAGRSPFETAVTLSAGGRVSITVTLPQAAPPPPPPPPTSSVPPPPPPPPPSSTPVGAWVAVGVGGVLAVGSVVSLVLRASNLSTMSNDCDTSSTPWQCNPQREGDVNSARSAAQIEGPLGIGLAAGAVVSLGIGAWLFATSSSTSSSAIEIVPTGPGLLVRGSL